MPDEKVKIALIGDPGAGKDQLINARIKKAFEENYVATLGVQMYKDAIEFEGKDIILDIYNIAGDIRFRQTATQFYKSADVIMIVCDLTSEDSINHIKNYQNEIKNLCDKQNNRIILVGTKSDLTDECIVSSDEFEKIGKKHGLNTIETSAKNGEGVEEAFTIAVRKALNFYSIKKTKESQESSAINQRKNQLSAALQAYIDRVEYYKDTEGENVYKHGFGFSLFKTFYGKNRKANCELAKKLIVELKKAKDDDAITAIFEKQHLKKERKKLKPFLRGIRSDDLNEIINVARNPDEEVLNALVEKLQNKIPNKIKSPHSSK